MKTDILFIHANASDIIYQDLSQIFSAIEPPIWAGMLAQKCLNDGFNAELIDCEALHMSNDDALHHIKNINPRCIAFVVYGQQPSASTQNMEGATKLAALIKTQYPQYPILFVGGHPSALPIDTLEKHPYIDYVCSNEGFYTIPLLLKYDKIPDVPSVPGLYFRHTGLISTKSPVQLMPAEELTKIRLPWHLFPMKHYKTSLWHSYTNNCERQPFASIYTSLGCPFDCSFCCINAPFGGKSYRYWQPEDAMENFDWCASHDIKNIKIADEMFVLNPAHFLKICELIIERKYNFNIWCYARVDTIKDQYLEKLAKAGIKWLALGIESANQRVRYDVTKGKFTDEQIKYICDKIHSYGINIMGNYIFGLPEDDSLSMKETFDLALSLNTEAVNFYTAMAYPGSRLYKEAIQNKWKLPDTYSGYSQHAYDTQPLPTKYLTASEVLKFRDDAWFKYHTNTNYLRLVQYKFGSEAVEKTLNSTKIKLKRKLLFDDKS